MLFTSQFRENLHGFLVHHPPAHSINSWSIIIGILIPLFLPFFQRIPEIVRRWLRIPFGVERITIGTNLVKPDLLGMWLHARLTVLINFAENKDGGFDARIRLEDACWQRYHTFQEIIQHQTTT